MTKSQLTTLIVQQLKLPRKDADTVVDTVFESIASSLEAGRRVELRGFGSFGLKERCAKVGRNPKTGESVAVEAKRVMYFKTGKGLKARVDRGSTAILEGKSYE
ncbi:MAG: integration host factor subunit beta [Magnetococcales bacterium]|nr:integration host factor subunit beta [Magnetococcales bacterium]